MSDKPFAVIVLAVLALAITIYIRSEYVPQALSTTMIGDDYGPAPDISMPIGPNGRRVDLSSMRGHVVMLDFWATWCNPCKLAIPDLENIYRRHKDEGLEVVGISVDEPSARRDVDSAVKALGITYPVTLMSEIPDATSKYTFASIPLLLIIDKKGIVRERISGYDPDGKDEQTVAKLLKERP